MQSQYCVLAVEAMRRLCETPAQMEVAEYFTAYGGPFARIARALYVQDQQTRFEEDDLGFPSLKALLASVADKSSADGGEIDTTTTTASSDTTDSVQLKTSCQREAGLEANGSTNGFEKSTGCIVAELLGSDPTRRVNMGVILNNCYLWASLDQRIPVRDLSISRYHMAVLLNDGRVFVYRHRTHPLVTTQVDAWEHISALDNRSVVAIRITSANLAPGWRKRYHACKRRELILRLRQEFRKLAEPGDGCSAAEVTSVASATLEDSTTPAKNDMANPDFCGAQNSSSGGVYSSLGTYPQPTSNGNIVCSTRIPTFSSGGTPTTTLLPPVPSCAPAGCVAASDAARRITTACSSELAPVCAGSGGPEAPLRSKLDRLTAEGLFSNEEASQRNTSQDLRYEKLEEHGEQRATNFSTNGGLGPCQPTSQAAEAFRASTNSGSDDVGALPAGNAVSVLAGGSGNVDTGGAKSAGELKTAALKTPASRMNAADHATSGFNIEDGDKVNGGTLAGVGGSLDGPPVVRGGEFTGDLYLQRNSGHPKAGDQRETEYTDQRMVAEVGSREVHSLQQRGAAMTSLEAAQDSLCKLSSAPEGSQPQAAATKLLIESGNRVATSDSTVTTSNSTKEGHKVGQRSLVVSCKTEGDEMDEFAVSKDELLFFCQHSQDGILTCDVEDLNPDWLPEPFALAALDNVGVLRIAKCCGYYNYPMLVRRNSQGSQAIAPSDASESTTRQGDNTSCKESNLHRIFTVERKPVRVDRIEKQPELSISSTHSQVGSGQTGKVKAQVQDVVLSEITEEALLSSTSPDVALALYAIGNNEHSAFVRGKDLYIRFKNFPTGPAKLHCGPLGHSGAVLLANGSVWCWIARQRVEQPGRMGVVINQVAGSLAGRIVVDLMAIGTEIVALTSDGVVHEWNLSPTAPGAVVGNVLRPQIPEPIEWTPKFQRQLIEQYGCSVKGLVYKKGSFNWLDRGSSSSPGVSATTSCLDSSNIAHQQPGDHAAASTPQWVASDFLDPDRLEFHRQQEIQEMYFSKTKIVRCMDPVGGGSSRVVHSPTNINANTATTGAAESTKRMERRSKLEASGLRLEDDSNVDAAGEVVSNEEYVAEGTAVVTTTTAPDPVERVLFLEGVTMFLRSSSNFEWLSNGITGWGKQPQGYDEHDNDDDGNACWDQALRGFLPTHAQALARMQSGQGLPLPANPVVVARMKLLRDSSSNSSNSSEGGSSSDESLREQLDQMASSSPPLYRLLMSPTAVVVATLQHVNMTAEAQKALLLAPPPLPIVADNPKRYLQAVWGLRAFQSTALSAAVAAAKETAAEQPPQGNEDISSTTTTAAESPGVGSPSAPPPPAEGHQTVQRRQYRVSIGSTRASNARSTNTSRRGRSFTADAATTLCAASEKRVSLGTSRGGATRRSMRTRATRQLEHESEQCRTGGGVFASETQDIKDDYSSIAAAAPAESVTEGSNVGGSKSVGMDKEDETSEPSTAAVSSVASSSVSSSTSLHSAADSLAAEGRHGAVTASFAESSSDYNPLETRHSTEHVVVDIPPNSPPALRTRCKSVAAPEPESASTGNLRSLSRKRNRKTMFDESQYYVDNEMSNCGAWEQILRLLDDGDGDTGTNKRRKRRGRGRRRTAAGGAPPGSTAPRLTPSVPRSTEALLPPVSAIPSSPSSPPASTVVHSKTSPAPATHSHPVAGAEAPGSAAAEEAPNAVDTPGAPGEQTAVCTSASELCGPVEGPAATVVVTSTSHAAGTVTAITAPPVEALS